MGRRRAPRPPAVAYDRLGDAQEALEAVAVLWRTLAATPGDARALLLAGLAHQQEGDQVAHLLHADPEQVRAALSHEHDAFVQRFRAVYGLITRRVIVDELAEPPELPAAYPWFSRELFAYLAQADDWATWENYLDYLDRQEPKASATWRGSPPSPLPLTALQRLPNPPTASESLSGADLTRADLTDAHLTDAHLTSADLTSADLIGADLTGARLIGADLTSANLAQARLGGADLTSADLTSAYLPRADLTGADLTGAYLLRTDLTHARLSDADLTHARLTHARLIGADLTDANLPRADLTGARLTDANLPRADLTGARLTATNLSDADLSDADLTDANLGGADLSGADLSGAHLAGAWWSQSTVWPDGWAARVRAGSREAEGGWIVLAVASGR